MGRMSCFKASKGVSNVLGKDVVTWLVQSVVQSVVKSVIVCSLPILLPTLLRLWYSYVVPCY